MFGLHRDLGAGMRRLALRLLAEIAPYRRPRGADRLAQRLRREMAIALLDGNLVSVDHEISRLVFFRARESGGRRRLVGPHGGAVEVLAPTVVASLEDHDAIREAGGGDDIGHWGSRTARKWPWR